MGLIHFKNTFNTSLWPFKKTRKQRNACKGNSHKGQNDNCRHCSTNGGKGKAVEITETLLDHVHIN